MKPGNFLDFDDLSAPPKPANNEQDFLGSNVGRTDEDKKKSYDVMNRLLDEVEQNENERKEIIKNENKQPDPQSNNTIPSQMNPNDILDFDVTPTSNQPVQNFMNTNGAEISRIEQGHDQSRNISNLDILGETESQPGRDQVPNQILDNANPQTNAEANVNLVTAASDPNMGQPSPTPPKEMPNFDDLDFDDLSAPAKKPQAQTEAPSPAPQQPPTPKEEKAPTPPQVPEPLDQAPAPPKSPQPAVSTGFDDIFDAPPPPKQNTPPPDSQRSLGGNKSIERKRSERLDEDDPNMYADTEGYDDEPGGYFNQNLYHNDDDDDYFSGNEENYDSYKRGDTQKSGYRGSKVEKKPDKNDDFL